MPVPPEMDNYVRTGRKSVDGWLTELDARIIAEIVVGQRERGEVGCVGEIGVHHGKLLLLLHLSITAEERTFAADLFEYQDQNVDRSGLGDKERFLQNIRKYTVGTDRIDIFEGNSADLSWANIQEKTGQSCRFFSVDGGHTSALTANDLTIAYDSLSDTGVICLDDYFNKEFADVSVGLNHFMSTIEDNEISPFGISDNKVLLCRSAHRLDYIERLRTSIPDSFHVKDTEFFGHQTPMFRTPRGFYDRIKQSTVAKRLRYHPAGEALKPYVRRVFNKN
ncbi:MAG: class I SAM-dependent methyltransferase [Proteobacteria bacterium]|nr:class I SAM-dependent methyltransferase [Pseudomonadota bacterium]